MVKRYEGKLYEEVFKSQHLGNQQKLLFYVPPNYTPLSTYDLLIAQDGNDYFQLGRIPRKVEGLIEEGEIREAIVVGVPYANVEERRKRYHPSGSEFTSYTKFLTEELLPYIENTFPTHELASSRTLAGDSLAGTVSLMTALQYPSLFGQVMIHSPFVNEKVLHAVKSYSANSHLTIYHRIGKEETNVKTTDGKVLDFLTPNRELRKLINEKNFSYNYEEFNGNHTWTYWQKDMENALKEMLPF